MCQFDCVWLWTFWACLTSCLTIPPRHPASPSLNTVPHLRHFYPLPGEYGSWNPNQPPHQPYQPSYRPQLSQLRLHLLIMTVWISALIPHQRRYWLHKREERCAIRAVRNAIQECWAATRWTYLAYRNDRCILWIQIDAGHLKVLKVQPMSGKNCLQVIAIRLLAQITW